MTTRPAIYRFGSFDFEPSQFELRNGDKRTKLPVAMYKLLLMFVSQPGKLVTRDQIADALWEEQGTIDTTAGVYTAIKRLRDQLGDDDAQGPYIQTVISAGYRFNASVSLIGADAGLKEASEAALPNSELPPSLHARRFSLIIFGTFALVLVAGLGVWRWFAHISVERVQSLSATSQSADDFLRNVRVATFETAANSLTAQAISPSGKFLSWADNKGIVVQTLTDGTIRPLIAPPDFSVTRIAWFPDESALLVSGNSRKMNPALSSTAEADEQLWRISLSGQAPQLLIDHAALGAVSPDGSRLAFTRADATELWISSAAGTSSHLLTKTADGSRFTCLTWLPKSDKLVISRYEPAIARLSGSESDADNGNSDNANGVEAGSDHGIYDAQSGALLAHQPGPHFGSAILLESNLIYLLASGRDPLRVAAVKLDMNRGNFVSPPRVLPLSSALATASGDANDQLSASANGESVTMILSHRGIDFSVADLTFANGGSQPKLTNIVRPFLHPYDNYPTFWSPDGRILAFDEGFHGPSSAFGQPMNGGGLIAYAVAKSRSDRFAEGHFSPDGKWLLYTHLSPDGNHIQSIERTSATGGTAAEVVPTKGRVDSFQCSTSSRGRCLMREIDGGKEIVFYDLDPVRGMGAECARIRWQPTILGDWSLSPDGDTIALANHDPAHPEIQLLNVPRASTGSASNPSVQAILLQGFGVVLGPTWSSDGSGFFVETFTEPTYNLLYMDRAGHISLLRQSPDLIFAIPSPNRKQIAFPENVKATRNVWIGTAQPNLLH